MGNGKFDEMGSSRASMNWFFFMALNAQVVGVIAVILLLSLFGYYRGGFGWTDLDQTFNNHPLCMTLGMVIFYGDAILVYRVFRNVKKLRVKILHGSLLLLSLIFSSIGLKAVFDNHNRSTPPKANLYSLHSWVGMTAVVLFGCQWIGGFVSFLFPKLSEDMRQAYMPTHKFWGKAIFLLGVAAVLMGITEYSIFSNIYTKDDMIPQRNLINVFGIFVVMFAIIILYLVGNPVYQRPIENESEHVPLTER